MSLYATLLVLAVLTLAPSSWAGQNEEPFSSEGSTVEEEDWNANSASGAGEDDQLHGFDSGSSWTDKGYNDEATHEFPRVIRNYSNKRSETSGNNGDKSGSGEDDRSKSNSHENEDHGSTNSTFDSSLELSKVVDAVDVLKKLKKAKSDEELVKKLKTGPETLGVAFKTFEQLSGLWISVMHRIWRVWKAKGAKVVMHSIVENLMNNAGRTIKRKVEDFLSKNTSIPREKVSINFIKTIPKEEQPWPSNKKEKAIIEKVKVSFKKKSANTSSLNNTSSSAKMAGIGKDENSSKTYNGSSYNMSNVGSRIKWGERHPLQMQKPLESKYHRNIKNVSLGNFENQVEKNRETGRRVKVTGTTDETGEILQQVSEKSHLQGKQADSPRTLNNQQKLLNNSFLSQDPDTQGQETSHVKNTNTSKGDFSKESHNSDRNNSPAKMNATLGKIEMEEAKPTKNPTKKSSVPEKVKINFLIKGEASHLEENNRNIFQFNTSSVEKRPRLLVQSETKPLTDSKGKSAELSKKSLYLTRNDSGVVRNSSNSDIGALFAKKRVDNKTLENITPSPTNSSFQLDSSKIQTNVLTSFAQNKAKTKPDSTGSAAELSTESHSATNISREKNILDKVALSFHDNATGNRSESDVDIPRTKEHFGNRTFDNLVPAPAKAENVFAETYRTEETKKSNSSFNEAKPTTSSNSSLTDSFDKNNKIESYAVRNASNVPEGDTNKKQAGGSRNTANIRDKMKYKVLGNSTRMLDKGVVNAKSQVEQKGKVLDNRMNLTVDSSNAELQNEKEDVLSEKRTPNVAQEDFMKVSGNGKNITDSNTIAQNDKGDFPTKESSQNGFQEDAQNAERLNHSQTVTGKANSALVVHTQEHKEKHSSQEAKEDNQEKLRNDRQESQKEKTFSVTDSALHIPSRNLTAVSKSSSVRNSLSTDVFLDGENDYHSSGVPTEHALKGTNRDNKMSPAESSRNSKTNSMVDKVINNNKVADRNESHTQEIDAKRGPGLLGSNIQLDKEYNTVHDSGSGSDMPHGVSAAAEKPENPTANDQGGALTKDKAKNKLQGSGSIVSFDPTKTVAPQKERHMTRQSKGLIKRERKSGIPYGKVVAIHNSQSRTINDQERTMTRKNNLGTIQRKTSSLEDDPEGGLLTDKKHGEVTHQSKDVLITSPQHEVQHEPKRVSPKAEKLVKINNGLLPQGKSHKLAIQVKMTSRISDKKLSPDSNDESRRHSAEHSSEDTERKQSINETKKEIGMSSTDTKAQEQTNDDKAPPKSQQVDVLTSRTPPTSLLTTSNDDNAYSIKEIVQGPKGPSLIPVYSGDRRIHGLEKKVVRLEDKVTILETAMAGLARRILDVEQNTDHPIPTTTTPLPPSNEVKLQHKHPINNQQQTTVYITKEVSAQPQTVAPQNGPQKIVIPISSLRSGRGRGVSTYPASIQEIDNNKEIEDDIPSEKRLEDSTHVTVPLAPSASPSSQAQAIVRPIVNIIVPNNRADELSTEATCRPRCQNGGRCLEGNTCRCPTFFSGVHCEKFSLKDLLESAKLRERTNSKLRRVVLSELPDQQDLDGTLSLDSGPPALEYRNLDQDEEPDQVFIAKQKPIDLTPPRNSVDAQGVTRRRQFILEI